MIWDMHHHWVNEKGYIDRLLKEMDRLGIERTGLIAMGDIVRDLFVLHEHSGQAVDDQDLARLLKTHGDRFWGFGYISPGRNTPEDIDKLVEMGMTALKLHVPLKPYGEPEYFDLYAKAAEHKLPCLFHTGIFYPPTPLPGAGIRSENYRPIHLEPIAHEFPDLIIIAAHLGVCWTNEAAALCRICPNIYADLSGRSDGWRSALGVDDFKKLLYWPTAHQKLLFGSDVHADEVESSLLHQRGILEQLGWSAEQINDVLVNNSRKLFA